MLSLEVAEYSQAESNGTDSIINQIESNLTQSNLYYFFLSLVAAILWTVYLSFYNSRVFGLILTVVLNKFVKYGHINFGSFSFSVLSGKIMVRDFHLVTEDFSIRIHYGWFILKWWRPYFMRTIGEDLSHAEARLYVFIDGFEFHVYNRSQLYDKLEQLFGLDQKSDAGKEVVDENVAEKKKSRVKLTKRNFEWRDLVPVIKVDINMCCFIFGNSLVPNNLVIRLDDAHLIYTSTPASTPFDNFMHDAKCNAENLRVMFVPNKQYKGPEDEPPRTMGDGFTVLQSTGVKIHYYMDDPGLVPYEPEVVHLADGQTVVKRTYPCMGVDIQCGKNTDFNYGPWADRQRECLWKFFYPSTYQPLVPSQIPKPGERRQYLSFEFRLNILADATIDILYTKNSVTQAIHINMNQGSYVEASMPWVVLENGYTTIIRGQMLLLEATNSMKFRSLLECETLDFCVEIKYPIEWNDHQHWNCTFTACKATLHLIFQHKCFFQDLIEDWSSYSPPDIYHFAPFTYHINILINQFELITLANEYNWIDTSSQHPENAYIAFCGDTVDLSILLPFTDFLSEINTIGLIIKGEAVFCRLYLPESNTSRHVVLALSENMKILDRDGKVMENPFGSNDSKQWRRATEKSVGWVDCWTTSNVALSLNFKYHSMPTLIKHDTHHIEPHVDDFLSSEADIEEAMLFPLRSFRLSKDAMPPDDFDPGEMDPDLLSLELEVAPSVLCLYGSMLRNLLHVKENYLGEDQVFTDFNDSPSVEPQTPEPEGFSGPLKVSDIDDKFDPRKYRPFAVTVSVTLHDIQAHLVKNCNPDDVACPCVFLERLGFEMDKKYKETKLQLLLSPAILLAQDNVKRDPGDDHLKEGHVALSGLQVRGHGMFSHEGLPLDSETLEYAWMVEAIIGNITGKLTTPQFQNIVEFLQTFIMLIEDPENSLQQTKQYKLCQHLLPQHQCKMPPKYHFPCPSTDDIKYKMTRLSIDSINLFIVESGTALNIQIYPLRLSTCDLHGPNTRSGITALIEHIGIKQYISTAPIRSKSEQPEVWLESGGLLLGPITAEAAMALPYPEFHAIQDKFLRLHDEKTLRLWFLWKERSLNISTQVYGKCGCHGGCSFFGNNRNGIGFFQPKKFKDVTPTAVFKVSPEGMDPGFGQSLLHKDRLIFDIIPVAGSVSPGKEFSFTRGYMSDLTSPDTPGTEITVMEGSVHSPGTEHSARKGSLPKNSKLSTSAVIEIQPSSIATGMTNDKPVMDMTSGTNPFDTASKNPETFSRYMDHQGSISLDRKTLKKGSKNMDEETYKTYPTPSHSLSQPSSPPFVFRQKSTDVNQPQHKFPSKVSHSSSTSKGTVSSPTSIRSSLQHSSLASLESDMYYSAEENSDSDNADSNKISLNENDEKHTKVTESPEGTEPCLTLTTGKSQMPESKKNMMEKDEEDIEVSSSSDSILSYMSADTDQEFDDLIEDFSWVDLHDQVNKPITKSPVLLPCYSSHLTQLHCSNWSLVVPFPSKDNGIKIEQSSYSLASANQPASYIHSTACLPCFVKFKQGFSTRIMKVKDTVNRMQQFSAMDKDSIDPWTSLDEDNNPDISEKGKELEDASRTTATVKLYGSLDILLTPLLLESFQRFAESVTPALSKLHPSSIIDGLHSRCLDRLKSQNRLMKAQSALDSESPDEDITGQEFHSDAQKLGNNESKMAKSMEMKTYSYKALFTLSRINICVLQAGMVEERISFSALDNINELTCISLLGICISNIKCQLLSNSHSCKSSISPKPLPINASPSSHKGKTEGISVDSEKEKKIHEILREEDVGTIHLSSLHLQLRRLVKNSNFSNDVILTAIPEPKSKVLFCFDEECRRISSPISPKSIKIKRTSSARSNVSRQGSIRSPTTEDRHLLKLKRFSTDESNPFDAAPQPKFLRQKSRERGEGKGSIGFIMFECGLEDISITAVRRLGYKEKSDVDFKNRMDVMGEDLKEAQNKTKAKLENETEEKKKKGSVSARSSKKKTSEAAKLSSKIQPKSSDRKSTASETVAATAASKSVGFSVDAAPQRISAETQLSWSSQVSIPSSASDFDVAEPLKGDASSGVLELKTIWFHFAAPPPLPINRKADFTRLDWNLLSTATPTMNAWMTPFDRLMGSIRNLVRELTHRTNSVMACVMTEGLEVQGIHMPYRYKFAWITTLSRTLQEDASCQLLTVLRKYLHKMGTATVEQAVHSDTVPQLITIQKGILALTRQWKNVLYMPHLTQYSFKMRKHRPYSVKFARNQIYNNDGDLDEDEREILDENIYLLGETYVKEALSMQSLHSKLEELENPNETVTGMDPHVSAGYEASPEVIPEVDPELEVPSVHSFSVSRHRQLGGLPKKHYHISSLGQNDCPEQNINDTQAKTLHSLPQNTSSYSLASAPASAAVADHAVGVSPPLSPHQQSIPKPGAMNANLYRWMVEQQSGFQSPPVEEEPGLIKRQDSFLDDKDDIPMDVRNAEQLTMATSIMQLADAQNLFKPFLQSIGLHVESVRPTAIMKKFGGNLSLQGKLDILKIQIADSDDVKNRKGKSRLRGKHIFVGINPEIPAFLCEHFCVNISMKDVIDFEKSGIGGAGNLPFKFAMHKLEAKPTTLQVNCLINCQAVTQYVDMPLLRLIHQFVTMVGNFNETRLELKRSHSSVDWIRTHRKQDSKGSTSSAETQQSDGSKTSKTNGQHGLKTELSLSNLNAKKPDIKLEEPQKTIPKQCKPSMPSFKLPFDTIRHEKMNFAAAFKKNHLRFSKDSKKPKSETKTATTPGQSSTQSEVQTPPHSLNFNDSINMEMADTSSPAVIEKTIVDEIKASTPKCWRTLYHLLELYSTMPETKTLGHKPDRIKLPVIEEEQESIRDKNTDTGTPSEGTGKVRMDVSAEEELGLGDLESTPLAKSTFSRTRFKQSIYIGDSIPLVVFGIAKLDKMKILAVLSGLKLEGELRGVQGSGTYKEKVKGFIQRKSAESSVTAHVGHTMISLFEGAPPNMQTVVTVNIAKSEGLHTNVRRRGKGHNSALVSIGEIDIDIPQHPVVLHGMMARSSRQLSTTLQEFRRASSRISRNFDLTDFGTLDSRGSHAEAPPSIVPRPIQPEAQSKPMSFHIHVKAILKGLAIGASLLPSLKAQHKIGPITLTATTVKKARFTLDLPQHTLSFKSKVLTTETSIPSSASIDLPPIHVHADYRHHRANASVTETLTEGLILKEGNYLNAVAEVGMFEHSLTTDLLNHLVFVQKVFMKEVNELLQKVSGADRPVPLWSRSVGDVTMEKENLLYSFHFRLKGIQITATTPTASAVRLETEAIELEVSNRIQMTSREAHPNIEYEDNKKVFIKAKVELNLALGQLLKNPIFEEAEQEFQTMAFFKTKIAVRNAIQDEMIPGVEDDQEALLINLTRPIILVQPMAFDKAVLVWLNYKNAYEYWTEQRMVLNKEVLTATRQVMNRLPQIAPTNPQSLSTLFLQLTVDDIGLCIPISPPVPVGTSRVGDEQPGSAVVLTIQSTQISACSKGSLVSKGKFTDFCLRIADDFETSLDDWKPNSKDFPVMNACVVPEGTYEVCSRTTNKQSTDASSNAKWILNVKWDMMGIDVHLDYSLGKSLSALGKTLTALTGEEEEDYLWDEMMEETEADGCMEELPIDQNETVPRRQSTVADCLPGFVYDTSVDPKLRARLIEKEMNEQARLVQELRESCALQSRIDAETRKLEELKAILFQDFKREFISRIKKQSERASVIKDKLGIGLTPTHARAKSFGGQRDKRRESNPEKVSRYNQEYESVLSSISTPSFVPTRVQFGGTLSTVYSSSVTPEDTPTLVPQPAKNNVAGIQAEFSPFDYNVTSESTEYLVQSSSESSTVSSHSESDDSDKYEINDVFTKSDEQNIHRRSGMDKALKSLSNPSIGSGGSKTVVEPSIDLELDVKVFIDSGKCVLHPKENKEDEAKRMKREKTPTAEGLQSPNSRRKTKKTDVQSQVSGPATSKKPAPQQPQIENTVFLIPGVDVKVHYSSRTDSTNSPSNTLVPEGTCEEKVNTSLDDSSVFIDMDGSDQTPNVLPAGHTITSDKDGSLPFSLAKRGGVKKASIYAWLSLQSLPEEMIISPCLLDYLEQTLEAIPITQPAHYSMKADMLESVLNMDLNASSSSLGAPAGIGSFPVDVVVFIRVEPSIIRFSCLPVSRVECLLQVPSLEVIFSTKRSDLETSVTGEGTPPTKAKFGKKLGRERHSSGSLVQPGMSRVSSASETTTVVTTGGLSMTCFLSDFSLYIFHPYGGGQRKVGQLSPGVRYLGSIQEQTPMSDLSRKDSLSLNVEFVRLNISRTRKLECRTEGLGEASSSNTTEKSSSPKGEQSKTNIVRFSAVCDIGTATFKYDMRRLSEILTFPKAWYRRNLARRLFLGDESVAFLDEGASIPQSPADPNPTDNFIYGTGVQRSNSRHRRTSLKRMESQARRNSKQTPKIMSHGSTSKSAAWETLVLFAMNLSRLDLTVNMSNVMGNTIWTIDEIKSQGRLSIKSSGHRNLKIIAGLGSSHFESKGGVVGGIIDLQDVDTIFEILEDPGLYKDPVHKAGMSLYAIEARVDYMGSSILMTRLSQMDIQLRDEWKIDRTTATDTPLATKRSALLFVHGDLTWDRFHTLISRSTTPDLVKIVSKLEEFIMQQFTSSKRAFSSIKPLAQRVKGSDKQKSSDDDSFTATVRHHRHWQKALQHIIGCHFSMLSCMLPEVGMILGGTMTLRGNNLSLACFHGINFRSKSWAIFTMNEPYICFATEAQKALDEGTHVVQDLTFYVGHDTTQHNTGTQMAHILKLSRGHAMPPTFTSAQEWFHYAFSSTEIKNLDAFPKMQRVGSDSPTDYRKSRKLQNYNHDTEVIFAFPSMQMQLVTKHLQGEFEPRDDEPRPVVECSFVTEFDDHICVAMDAEVILFIHDLVSMYIKEKDKGTRTSSLGQLSKNKAADGEKAEKSKITNPTTVLQQDWRQFECKTWQLEPTVRLLHWASKQIDPVGADYVLQKLGFSHARVTIPKWMQRGFMDPLDKVLAVLVDRLILILREKEEKTEEQITSTPARS
ncbi:hypothetical protein ACJMK2_032469 [Sinanodonta woodiana]|uniref:Bridge-like lipid transfer protein family member 1 C-terminal domain-containing protein n=1 Tax=Sinanodonta woodiana TaxID=1069815 RepID=A0ABD3X2D3_SINWO